MNIKISVIGAGNVGGLTAMRLAEAGLGDIVLVDKVPGLAKAKALDLEDASAVLKYNYNIQGTEDVKEIKDSDIVVITAGLARKPGMSREELLNKREEHLFPNCLYSCGICDVQYLYTPNYKFFAILIKNEKQILIDYFHTEHLNVRIFRMDIVRQFHICSEDFSRYRDDKLHNGVVRLVLP